MFFYRDIEDPSAAPDEFDYAGLWSAACGYAEALDGLAMNSHVMLVMPLGRELVAAHLAVLQQGGRVSIFTHPSEKMRPDVYGRNLMHAIETVRPDAIVVAREFLDIISGTDLAQRLDVIVADDVAATTRFEPHRWKDVPGHDAAVIQYSSGSTGMQKCVALSHDMVNEQIECHARFIGLDPGQDHISSWLPLYHDMGLFASWLMPVTCGVPVSMIDPFKWVKNPVSLLELIDERRATLTWLPNFAFKLLSNRITPERIASLDLSSLRGITNCSEPCSASTMQEFRETFARAGLRQDSLWVCYAMAENAFAVTASGGPNEEHRTVNVDVEAYAIGQAVPADEQRGIELVSCGVPIDRCRLRIVDESRNDIEECRIGEIAITSPFLLNEYLGSPPQSAEAIDADGWYYTGDLGFLWKGRLYITGRKKDLLIVGGRNFYPQDIEAICNTVAGAIPGRCVALGIDDASLGTQKVLVIVESDLEEPQALSPPGG